MGCQSLVGFLCVVLVSVSGVLLDHSFSGMDIDAFLSSPVSDADGFVPLSMIELEEHEDTETSPFSVCKFLLETSAQRVGPESSWPEAAKHIAEIRDALPEHVRSACDTFIKSNRDEILSLLQLASSSEDDGTIDHLMAVADQQQQEQQGQQPSASNNTPSPSQQDLFQQFWEEKGKYCGACLTMTKKLQKWLSMNCTQTVIGERVMRMCGTMPPSLKLQCESNRLFIVNFVIRELFTKFPLPNHCAYIGLCEKTMVIRALQNPLVMAESQDALIQDMEGTNPDGVQESQAVLQRPYDTPNTAPEITFELGGDGGVSYRDVDRSLGDGLPKVFVDGTHEPTELRDDAFSLLETESQTESPFDLSVPDDPHVTLKAQENQHVNIPIMHADLKENGQTVVHKTYGFQENHLPIETRYLKACASCQFTIGALFEFMSSPRAIRSILPSVKSACKTCNSPEEVLKCEQFVENHGVAFYQDVMKQGQPSKWCPRLDLCEIQYFYPSPHVLSDTYERVKERILSVGDF